MALWGGLGCIRGSGCASRAAQHVLPPHGASRGWQGSFFINQGAKLPREVESRVGPPWEVLLIHQEWEILSDLPLVWRGAGSAWVQGMVNSCVFVGNWACFLVRKTPQVSRCFSSTPPPHQTHLHGEGKPQSDFNSFSCHLPE